MRNEFLRKFLATQLFANMITFRKFSFSKMKVNLKMILTGHMQPTRIMQFLRIKTQEYFFFKIGKNIKKNPPNSKAFVQLPQRPEQ